MLSSDTFECFIFSSVVVFTSYGKLIIQLTKGNIKDQDLTHSNKMSFVLKPVKSIKILGSHRVHIRKLV